MNKLNTLFSMVFLFTTLEVAQATSETDIQMQNSSVDESIRKVNWHQPKPRDLEALSMFLEKGESAPTLFALDNGLNPNVILPVSTDPNAMDWYMPISDDEFEISTIIHSLILIEKAVKNIEVLRKIFERGGSFQEDLEISLNVKKCDIFQDLGDEYCTTEFKSFTQKINDMNLYQWALLQQAPHECLDFIKTQILLAYGATSEEEWYSYFEINDVFKLLLNKNPNLFSDQSVLITVTKEELADLGINDFKSLKEELRYI